MKVAFATSDELTVNEHFGRSGKFVIYDMTPERYSFVEVRVFAEGRDKEIEDTKGMGAIHDSKVEAKADRLSDCKIIYLTEIGGPSAARLIKRGIMPIKVKEGEGIEESLKKLQETLKTSPPPWLKKAMTES